MSSVIVENKSSSIQLSSNKEFIISEVSTFDSQKISEAIIEKVVQKHQESSSEEDYIREYCKVFIFSSFSK
jgi:BioD-like phosphotransacetylase family protein